MIKEEKKYDVREYTIVFLDEFDIIVSEIEFTNMCESEEVSEKMALAFFEHQCECSPEEYKHAVLYSDEEDKVLGDKRW